MHITERPSENGALIRADFLGCRAVRGYSLKDFLDWYFSTERMWLAGQGSFSDYAETHILDHALGKTSWTMPTTIALALCTTVPTDASTGANIVEANYTGYGRQTIAGAGWNAAASGTPSSSTNNGAITFAACTAGSSVVIGWDLADSATTSAGNSIVWGTTTSVTINTTQTPATVASGALQVTQD
jgi:hypothetical protein